ncbi:DUF4850 domain-containing protein [Acinetobacter bereziniae]|uniref:DUF4850 domain-containing protein n=1 Tax=Acinetobacter bereziniae TaxID=106648 RepID=UPI00158027B5|nr:DUF4850 domain-containing protein [Acinetobacter bereziniae]NUF61641.1 DUF4850 domain-containing protein [Acinetobacter bereziniae]NUG07863.1 DUF4850 domain-containing protein [Acinetobacter bereziniae]NUG62855.1 DUF4850 domain-containing protein [Acinetobacter bereziniae]NUG71186.1 DUF4850 domain-containing protein [Acinetobacter bereziniae]NUG80028.1 DUF4850 domain-containing protein [Acinetobacter bereziniae]
MLKQKILIMILFLLSGFAYGDISIFKATFPTLKNNKAPHQQHHIEKLPATRLNHDVFVDTYIAAIPNPFNDTGFYKDDSVCNYNKTQAVKCQFNYQLSTTQAKNFKIILLPGIGPVLIPKTWQVISTDLGPSGVAYAVLASPQKDEAITIYNSSACVGCAMHSASLYFPNVRKLSLANEFGAIEDKNHLLKIVRVNKNKVYFSYQIPNHNAHTHGIAYYVDESDGSDITNFQEIKVTLKPQHQTWARDILNFYQSTH